MAEAELCRRLLRQEKSSSVEQVRREARTRVRVCTACPGGLGRRLRAGAGSEGTPSQGTGVFHGEGTCKQHLQSVYQPCQGSSS